jgi:hypothetical protein
MISCYCYMRTTYCTVHTQCGKFLILEYLRGDGGVGEVVVPEVEGAQRGHVAHLIGYPVHVVPLHRQMLQLGQLGHLRRYRPECGIRTVEV